MKNDYFSDLTQIAIEASLRSGDILKKGFGSTFEIFKKQGTQDLVTEYDKASEKCIISCIREKFPHHHFLAEESGFSSLPNDDTIVWIIDPLDGTTNFVHQLPVFTISIAAYYQDQALCGVIFQPLTNELFVAEKGKGAYLNYNRLQVSQTEKIEDGVFAISLPYDPHFQPILDISSLLYAGVSLRNFGSAALSLAYLAAGRIDALWMYHLYPWDIAAGQLLIEEAGGILMKYQISNNNDYAPTHILATNQILHPTVKNYLSY